MHNYQRLIIKVHKPLNIPIIQVHVQTQIIFTYSKMSTDCLLYTKHNVRHWQRRKRYQKNLKNSLPCEGNTPSHCIVINAMIILSTGGYRHIN